MRVLNAFSIQPNFVKCESSFRAISPFDPPSLKDANGPFITASLVNYAVLENGAGCGT
jgi:hypothetical protein